MTYTDIADKRQYIYSTFQPYFAHRVFACFDQQDLKAKMNLSVIYGKNLERALSNQQIIADGIFSIEKYLENAVNFDRKEL